MSQVTNDTYCCDLSSCDEEETVPQFDTPKGWVSVQSDKLRREVFDLGVTHRTTENADFCCLEHAVKALSALLPEPVQGVPGGMGIEGLTRPRGHLHDRPLGDS